MSKKLVSGNAPKIIVAGHICLDVIPTFPVTKSAAPVALVPGRLLHVGAASRSTGGAVPNTGGALHKLGLPVELLAKVGDDGFGAEILQLLRTQDPKLAAGIKVERGAITSYTIVLSPPGMDRIFLHCSGANDTFTAQDISAALRKHHASGGGGGALFHFGYPPLMRQMYQHGGHELQRVFAQAHAAGLTTSLDMAFPDLQAEAGQMDWSAILKRVLPQVDIFLPSVEELLIMLDRPTYMRALKRSGKAGGGGFSIQREVDGALLHQLSGQLLELGVAVAVIKLGDQGIYLRTTSNVKRLQKMGRAAPKNPQAWCDREFIVPCFRVQVAGTTGSGDCTIAGFLAAVAQGADPESAATTAVAVGACSVEQPDATSGVPTWNALQKRLAGRWPRLPVSLKLTGWTKDQSRAVGGMTIYRSPLEASTAAKP